MNRHPAIIVLATVLTGIILFLGLAQSTKGQDDPKLVKAKDGSGIIGYKDTFILPWCGYHVHDPDRPAPEKVTPSPRRSYRPDPYYRFLSTCDYPGDEPPVRHIDAIRILHHHYCRRNQ